LGAAAYSDNGWVIWHGGRLVLLDARGVLNSEVLHVASSEDDILVDLVRRTDLLFWPAFATLCTEGAHILEGNGRLVGVDFVKHTNIAIKASVGADCACTTMHTEYRSWR
jgi:hypothetical protein